MISAVTFCTNSGAAAETAGGRFERAGRLGGHRNLMQMCERGIDRREVLSHDRLAAFAVSLPDRLLDLCNRFIARQHTADREEAGLHDRVDAIAKLILFGNRIRIDRIDLDLLVDDLSPELSAADAPKLRRLVRTVKQQRRARLRPRPAPRSVRGS